MHGSDFVDEGGTFSQSILRLKIYWWCFSVPSLLYSNYVFGLGFKPMQDDFQHDFAREIDEADGSVVLAEL